MSEASLEPPRVIELGIMRDLKRNDLQNLVVGIRRHHGCRGTLTVNGRTTLDDTTCLREPDHGQDCKIQKSKSMKNVAPEGDISS